MKQPASPTAVDALIKAAPHPMAIVTPEFTIVAVNDAYVLSSNLARPMLVGKSIFELFPDNPGDPTADGQANLRASFERVLTTRAADRMPIQRYDVRTRPEHGGEFKERYWSPLNYPILDDDGRVTHIIHQAEEVTERYFFRDMSHLMRAEADRERLAEQSERERRIYHAALSNTPDLVYVFDIDHRFVYANEALLKLWGRREEEAIGKTCLELGYEPWHAAMHDREIDRVFATRQPVRGEVPFTGTIGRRIYDYIFVPVIGADGSVQAVAGSTRDVTDRKAAEQALKDADRRKDEFLAMLAHELRNPLAAVGNAATVLKLSNDQENINFAKDVIERQTRQLARLIDDLLDVSRITSGKIRLKKELCDAGLIVRQAIESVTPLVAERKHELVAELDSAGLPLRADPIRVEQIVVNLLTNAAKYSDNGSRIHLTALRRDNEVVITVKDDGIGIAPEKLPEMFQLFAQGERSIARSEGGLGIGLTIVQKLTEMHDGRVTASSEGIGKGSTFTVYLPAARPAETHFSPDGRALAAGKRGSRILVVDDNIDTATGMARLLRLLGNEVQLAHDGHSAVDVARMLSPDFILLDIGLPGMNGYQVAQRLRHEPCCKNTLIIAVSGYGQEEDRRRSREAGFDHHLVKPVDFDSLLSLMAQSQ